MQSEPRYEDVERRNPLSPTELFEQYMKPRKPVVITGASVWKGGEPFPPGYVKSRHGHLRIDQLRHAEGGFNTHSAETILRVPTLGHLLEGFEDASSCDLPYLINLSIPLNFPELMPYLGAQEYASPNWLRKGLLGKAFNQRGLADGEMFLGRPLTIRSSARARPTSSSSRCARGRRRAGRGAVEPRCEDATCVR